MRPKHSRSQPNQQILAEASSWFIDFRAGDIDARARVEFHGWLRRSPEHIHAYMEIASTYAELPAPSSDGQLDVAALIAHARSAPEANVISFDNREARISGTQPRPARRSRSRLAVAATVLITAASFTSWYHIAHETYSTEVGEQRSLALEDGSTVELNSDSRMRVRYTGRERHIDLLRGQALFEVARDATRPFVVQAEQARVRAVGTRFDVYRKQSGTVVTVLEGRVAVQSVVAQTLPEASRHDGAGEGTRDSSRAVESRSVDEVLLAAGEQLIVGPTFIEKPQHADVAVATAWTSRQLIFDATPLTEVAAEFNRYSTRRLVIASEALAGFHVSGTYSSKNPESLLRFLRAQPGLQLTETEDEIRVIAQ